MFSCPLCDCEKVQFTHVLGDVGHARCRDCGIVYTFTPSEERSAAAGDVAVYLSDGETWDTIEDCKVVFYTDKEWEWGDGPKGFHSVWLEDLVSCYLKGLSDGKDGAGRPQDGSTE